MHFRHYIAALSSLGFATAAQAVDINGEEIPYSTWHHMMLPGETLTLGLDAGENASINGEVIGTEFTPQDTGNHTLVVQGVDGSRVATVSIFVMTPSSAIDERGYIGKFRMGFYPKDTPRGFIQLQEGEGDMSVSPGFNVGQFLCKQQPGEWPKYLLVSGDNLIRLETLLADLREEGLTNAKTFFVMSGYRSPFYNTAIGSAKFSRHMYGDAADVYLDTAPRDGNMDDINKDGRITKADANFLYDHSKNLFEEADVEAGGLGSYKANAVHGPFVHIDARGRPARWGR